MKRYLTYKRVSTKRQGKSGLGRDAQQRDIQIFLSAYAKEPFEIVAEFTHALSGGSDERPEFKQAIALAKETGAELLVAKLDRLSRKVSFIANLMDDEKLNLRVAVMPNADPLQLHLYAALAKQERAFISIRTKGALREAKARGRIDPSAFAICFVSSCANQYTVATQVLRLEAWKPLFLQRLCGDFYPSCGTRELQGLVAARYLPLFRLVAARNPTVRCGNISTAIRMRLDSIIDCPRAATFWFRRLANDVEKWTS